MWLYSSAGFANGDRDNSLANWYFGAFGNNYVDDREIRRYRKFFSFPGFDLDELSAQDFAKTVLEWNLPPMRFDSLGIPSLFLSSARTALFAGALAADIGDSQFRETYYDLGLQIDFAFTIAHRHSMILSLGYAQGYKGSDKADTEVMISLKVL
ncbi:MAG: hypothetical protein GWP58_14910 [Gammaproteobacteria bacterium]|nr:hypothetical protein [Gammaproteobacteria bacterium]